MYEQFYGLTERPFSLNPDPFFLYQSKKHKKALNLMEYGLINQAAFSVITGEIGTGKTTLVRQLLHQIDKKVSIGLLTSTHHSFGELLKLILIAFDLDHRNKDKAELYQTLYDFLIEEYSRRHQVVLIIDEAQNMAPDTLEELRMLSNINVEEHNVLQMILVGQEGLRDMLRGSELEQFAQRIAVDYHLQPLDRVETHSYILHRLQVAGSLKSRYTFDMGACDAVYQYTGGTPRLINMLCDVALVYGFAEQQRIVTAELIYEAVLDKKGGGILPLREIAGPFADAETDQLNRLHTPPEEPTDDDASHDVNNSDVNSPSDAHDSRMPEVSSDHAFAGSMSDEIAEQAHGEQNRQAPRAKFRAIYWLPVFSKLLTRLTDKDLSAAIKELGKRSVSLSRKLRTSARCLWYEGKMYSLDLIKSSGKYAPGQYARISARIKSLLPSADSINNYLEAYLRACRRGIGSLTSFISGRVKKIAIALCVIAIAGSLTYLVKAEFFHDQEAVPALTQEAEAAQALNPSDVLQPPPVQLTPEVLDDEEKLTRPLDAIPILHSNTASVERPREVIRIPARSEHKVIVKAGNTLSAILLEELGRYDEILLDEVLRLNPDIVNPDLIEVGQIITLPASQIN